MESEKLYPVLERIATSINKKVDIEAALPGEKAVKGDVKMWVPTRSTILNLLMGDENFGVACGRIFELFGDFGEGKSTLAQIIMSAFQAAGGISVLLDSECSWNRVRAMDMGHDPKRHMAVDIETCEMAFEVIGQTIEQFKLQFGDSVPIIFVWDTLAATPMKGQKEGDEYEKGMMAKPRLIRAELAKLTPELKKINASILFVNQTIEGPHANRSGVKTTSGGGGVKFWASQRIQVDKVETVRDDVNKEKAIGIISNVKMVKNKLHPPFKKADIPIDFKFGVDYIKEMTNYLLDNTSVYNVAGAWKSIVGFKEADIKFYERDLPKVIAEHEGLFDWLKENVRLHWTTGRTLLDI